MLRHVIFLLFLYGINDSSSQPQTTDSKDVSRNGIKKNEVGANGVENNSEEILKNFRNPVLEYLLHKNSERTAGPPKNGIIREIRHSQTLLVPNFPGGFQPVPASVLNQLPTFQTQKKPSEEMSRNPDNSPLDNFWNYLKNKTDFSANKTEESCVSSPVLHLHKNTGETRKESTRIQVYPAVGVVVNTYNADGTLKNSVTHFQPDFNSVKADDGTRKEATYVGDAISGNINFRTIPNTHHTVNNFLGDAQNAFPGEFQRQRVLQQRQGASPPVPWPFANYFPIVINDPFLSVYNAFTTSMYNAVSSMVEYGPEADICSKHPNTQARAKESESDADENGQVEEQVYNFRQRASNPFIDRYRIKNDDVVENKPNFFKEVTMGTDSGSLNKRPLAVGTGILGKFVTSSRKRRDTTSIFLKTRQGDKVDISIEEPTTGADLVSGSHDERARSFSQVLVNPPPLSTILKPPHSESRQFLGYADKKRKSKPSKPIKEESSSEEIGEENEEETTSQVQESANSEAVAISPPPEGASVAEAKPIGLAIAGPGGVAASKPQGTAVAGPGGLAIARPVGTAIAGVEVEGSVPIGGQHKNKKKPKQEQEQTDSELHYVGGLTGPIGNPQPKEFADGLYYKSVRETEGNNIQDNLFFRGRHNTNGFQLKLGQQDGRYGFIPMFSSPVQGSDRLQKRMDSPTFFHGLLGNNAQGNNDQIQNYQY